MLTRDELLRTIKSKADAIGSQRQLAKKWHMTPQELNAVLNGQRSPSKQVLARMGLEAVTMYRPKPRSLTNSQPPHPGSPDE